MNNTTFYHLSESDCAMAIVSALDKRAMDPKKYFSPRTPRRFHKEPNDERICVAPSVHQCLGAMPIRFNSDRALYIYKLQCVGAIKVEADVVEDSPYSAEHWITDIVISENGGEIPLGLVGVILESQVAQNLLHNLCSEQRSLLSDSELWHISAATPAPHWKILIQPSSSSTEEEPLQSPKW